MGGLKVVTMKALATLLLFAASSCTPGMHRAYQVTMATVAVGSDACSILQTRAVLRSGAGQETDFMLGKDPSDLRLGGAFAVNAAVVGGTLLLPDRGDRATMDWARDVLVTTEAVLFAYMAHNDNTLTGDPHRCGL